MRSSLRRRVGFALHRVRVRLPVVSDDDLRTRHLTLWIPPTDGSRIVATEGLASLDRRELAALIAVCESHSRSVLFELVSGVSLFGSVVAAVEPATTVTTWVPESVVDLVDRSRRHNDLPLGLHTVSDTTIDDYVAGGGTPPTVLSIASNQLVSEVLRGGRRTVEVHRPSIIVDLAGIGRRRCRRFLDLLRSCGYEGYRLTADPDWTPRSRWPVPKAPAGRRLWLFTVEPLATDLPARFDVAYAELSACVPNPREASLVRAGLVDTAEAHGWGKAGLDAVIIAGFDIGLRLVDLVARARRRLDTRRLC